MEYLGPEANYGSSTQLDIKLWENKQNSFSISINNNGPHIQQCREESVEITTMNLDILSIDIKNYQIEGTGCICTTRTCYFDTIISQSGPPNSKELPIEKWKSQTSYEEAWSPMIQGKSSATRYLNDSQCHTREEASSNFGFRIGSTTKLGEDATLGEQIDLGDEGLWQSGMEEALSYIGVWQNDNLSG
jgi:hypothetical protein